jgi:hypothetical protein
MAWEVCFDDSRRVPNAHWFIHLSTHKQLRLGSKQSDPHLGPFNKTARQGERSHTILFGFYQCINSLPMVTPVRTNVSYVNIRDLLALTQKWL